MVTEIYLNKPVCLRTKKKKVGQLILLCHKCLSPSPIVRNLLLWARLCVPLTQAGGDGARQCMRMCENVKKPQNKAE